MAVNVGEILDQLNKGVTRDKVYTNFITKLSKELSDKYREFIKENTKSDSNSLAASIVPFPTSDGFELQGDFYFKFIDQGVNAAPKVQGIKYIRSLVQGSPYSFKNLGVSGGMFKAIREIVPGSSSNVYAVAVSIKKHGIRAKKITDNVMTDKLLEQIAIDLTEVTGIQVDVIFETKP